MSSANFTLEGTENLKEIFKEFPEGGYRTPLNAAFKDAADPVKKAMIQNLPSNLKALKRIVKFKVSRKSKGEPSLAVGFFNRQGLTFRNKRGVNWDPYTIAFWHNYGTLDWRANMFHQFKSPVRRRTKTGSMQGLKPLLFVERGWDQSKGRAQKIFEEMIDRYIMKFFEKHANK
jgi:hypothetical protein